MATNQQIPKKWVLVRGLIRSEFHWKNFGNDLKNKLNLENVQTVELSGNGHLFNEKTTSDIKLAVAQLRSQVNLSDQEPIGLIGISLGGMLATAWAQINPEEVSHLILINSSSKLSPFYKRLLPGNYPALIKHFIFSKPEQVEEFILQTTSNNTMKWQSELSNNIQFLKQHPISVANFIKQLKLATQVDFKTKPQAHTMLLTSKMDRLVSCECSQIIAKTWQSQIFFHETAGHDLPLDDANWILNKIQKFIT